MKKISIFFLVILLFLSPVFALGANEDSVTETKKTDKKVAPLATTTSAAAEPAKASNASTTAVAKEKPAAPAASVSANPAKSSTAPTPVISTELTSLSTPVYKVELYDAVSITKQELDEAVAYYSSQLGYQVAEKEVLEELVDNILFNQALEKALKDGVIDVYSGEFNTYVSYQLQTIAAQYGYTLTSTEDAEAFLKQFGSTYENFANDCLTTWAQEQYIEKHSDGKLSAIAEPTNEEIEKFYKENMNMFVGDSYVKTAHLFFDFGNDKVAAKSRADKASEQLKSNAITFEKACIDYSEDDSTKNNGGMIDLFIGASEDAMKEAFGENALKVLFALEIGQISDVVEGAQGYHIFKVLNHKESTLLGLDDLYNPNAQYSVRYVIGQNLMTQKYQETYYAIYQDIIKDLRSQASLKSLI